MREIARKLNLSTTDTFRQLQRLNDALLVQKQNDGSYGITQYGIFVLRFSAILEFLFKNRKFFSSHDFTRLPSQFLDRIGELSKAEVSSDTMASINVVQRIIREADQYVWTGAVEQPLSIRHILVESIPRGVKYKFLFPKRLHHCCINFSGNGACGGMESHRGHSGKLCDKRERGRHKLLSTRWENGLCRFLRQGPGIHELG